MESGQFAGRRQAACPCRDAGNGAADWAAGGL